MSSVKDFGAVGDGRTDDTEAIEHAVQQGDGRLRFPKGEFRISRTVEIDLDAHGPIGIDGTGGVARVIMSGSGPAFRLIGGHGGTGDPGSVRPEVKTAQRMPTVRNIEVTGTHPEADGFELIQTMQPLFEGVMIREVRHGIHLIKRNRNVLISHSHIYNNSGVGVFLEDVNLHQINIASNHISYNRLGGIRIERSEVRNLQITGNDIEYNNHRAHGTEPEPTAEIYVDTTAEGASVNEITIASNTIQATPSVGGANIRILENRGEGRPPGLWTISGNIIGSQENNVHLTGCHGVILNGNFIYSCANRNVLIEDSTQINLSGNCFRQHTSGAWAGIRLVRSADTIVNGCTLQDHTSEGQPTGASLIELDACRRIQITGCQVLDGVPYGIDARDCQQVLISGCTVDDTREAAKAKGLIRFGGTGNNNVIQGNIYGNSNGQALEADQEAGVKS